MTRVVVASEFERSTGAQIRHLQDIDRIQWVERLELELSALIELLARYPLAGRELKRSHGVAVRKFRLRQLPLYVWYEYDDRVDELRLLRLFHVRQRRLDLR